MWDASLVSLPMFTDGIATKWASHIHRGLTVYTEQSLVPPLFYHSIDISCTFPLFPYSMNLYITYFFYWHLYINHSAKEKKFMRFLWQKQGNCCSSLQHQTHSYHKLQVRPSQLKGVLLLLLLKTIILLILLIVYILIIAEWLHVKLFITTLRDMRIRYKEITLNDLVPKGSHPQNLNRHTCDLS